MVSQLESETVSISYAGERYYLGFSDKFFAIYDKLDRRGTFTEPVQIFQKTQQGWEQAWHLFSSWEPHLRQIPTKIISVNHANDFNEFNSTAGVAGADKNYSRPAIVLKSVNTGVASGRYQPVTLIPVKNQVRDSIVGSASKQSKFASISSVIDFKALLKNLISILKAIFDRIDDLIQNPVDALKYQKARLVSFIGRDNKTTKNSAMLNVKSNAKTASVKSQPVASAPVYSPAIGTAGVKNKKSFAKRSAIKHSHKVHYGKNRSSLKTLKSILILFGLLAVLACSAYGYQTYKNDRLASSFPSKAQSICSNLTAQANPLVQQINAGNQGKMQLISDIANLKIAQSNAVYSLLGVAPNGTKARLVQLQGNLSVIAKNETTLSNAIATSNTAQIAQTNSTLSQLNTSFNSELTAIGIGSCSIGAV